MNETVVTIIIAVLGAFGSVITAFVSYLAKKAVNYLDEKTKLLDEANQLQKKQEIKQKIIDVVTLTARSTMQTYTEELKTRNQDGKLTKEEANEAFRKTYEQAWSILSTEGIAVTKEMLSVIIEAVVGKLNIEKKTTAAQVA